MCLFARVANTSPCLCIFPQCVGCCKAGLSDLVRARKCWNPHTQASVRCWSPTLRGNLDIGFYDVPCFVVKERKRMEVFSSRWRLLVRRTFLRILPFRRQLLLKLKIQNHHAFPFIWSRKYISWTWHKTWCCRLGWRRLLSSLPFCISKSSLSSSLTHCLERKWEVVLILVLLYLAEEIFPISLLSIKSLHCTFSNITTSYILKPNLLIEIWVGINSNTHDFNHALATNRTDSGPGSAQTIFRDLSTHWHYLPPPTSCLFWLHRLSHRGFLRTNQ